MIIDAHQHFWIYDKKRHSWMGENMKKLRRDFMPDELSAIYSEQGIDGCVAVQVDQTPGETDFLLKLCRENDIIKGVVGWADLRAGDIEEFLETYSGEADLKGFRHIVQDEPDPNFLLRADFLNGIAALEKHGFTYDILVFPHQLGAVLELVRKFPHQKFIIDHLAKPYIRDGYFDGWATLISAIANHQNVYCKLSGMVTEADWGSWSEEELRPYMQHVLEAFGPRRLVYGSDWPVCLLAASYPQVKNVAGNFISRLSAEEQQAIWGGNAIDFYKL